MKEYKILTAHVNTHANQLNTMESGNPVKILLVDDRAENLLALEVILSSEKYVCVKANSGKDALKILLREQDFAIILMDVQMPLMDGFETAELIRQSEKLKDVPIVFLTAGMNTSEQIFKGYLAGAVDYMIKPLVPEILKAKVSVFVDLYKKNHELQVQKEQMRELNIQLLKQTQYVRSLIEASLDPMITINSAGEITDMNEALEVITGKTREKLIGTHFFEYFTNEEMARGVYEQVFAEGSIVEAPLTLRNQEDELIDMLCNGSVYRDDLDEVMGVVIVAREKVLSKYSRTLIEASLDPLVTISPEGKITDMNQATVNITGIDRAKIKGTDFFDYFTEQEKARKAYQEVFENGFVLDYPLTLRHDDGKLTEVLFNGSVYKDDRGNVLGVVIVARDITAQKLFENELIEAKKSAEREKQVAEIAVKSKQQFLANMSHEIRTPMNAIIGFTKVILKTDLTEKQKEYLSAIKTAGDALLVLINDILDLAKVDAGKMTFSHIPFRLSSSIDAMLHMFDTKIEESNLELVREYDQSIPEVLAGDSVRLHQIILNLMSNAIKFTQKGKITFSVRLAEEDQEKVTIAFAVSDTGIGIPESKLVNIFEDFQQATSKTGRLFGGTGLGLAIVKQLIEAQGGTIEVKSKVGIGSCFSFVLKFKKTDKKIKIDGERNLQLEKHLKHVKVLVAEDVPLNQLLIRTLLEDFGFELDIANNGRQAIEKLENTAYDIVLMDLQMPEMNGFEATEHIRSKMNFKIPIIALTADVTATDVEKCRSVGMTDYISKPIDETVLYETIVKYVMTPDRKKTETETKKGEVLVSRAKCIKLDYLKRLTKNNTETMRELIEIYLAQTPKYIQNMKEAIENKNWETLRIATHSIIPSFSIVGIQKEFETAAKTLEKQAASLVEKSSSVPAEKESSELIRTLFLKIEAVCLAACAELKKELQNEI
jgi:PAS domain S-box-containing protein